MTRKKGGGRVSANRAAERWNIRERLRISSPDETAAWLQRAISRVRELEAELELVRGKYREADMMQDALRARAEKAEAEANALADSVHIRDEEIRSLKARVRALGAEVAGWPLRRAAPPKEDSR